MASKVRGAAAPCVPQRASGRFRAWWGKRSLESTKEYVKKGGGCSWDVAWAANWKSLKTTDSEEILVLHSFIYFAEGRLLKKTTLWPFSTQARTETLCFAICWDAFKESAPLSTQAESETCALVWKVLAAKRRAIFFALMLCLVQSLGRGHTLISAPPIPGFKCPNGTFEQIAESKQPLTLLRILQTSAPKKKGYLVLPVTWNDKKTLSWLSLDERTGLYSCQADAISHSLYTKGRY